MLFRHSVLSFALVSAVFIACGGEEFEGEEFAPEGEEELFELSAELEEVDGGDPGLVEDASVPPPDLEPILAKIAARVVAASPNTDPAIAVTWLSTGQQWDYHGTEAHVAASSAKFIWAAAALHAKTASTVEPYAVPTFKRSDNSAAGKLIDLAGGANAVNRYTSTTLGIPSSRLWLCSWNYGRTRRASSCPNRASGNNYLTALGSVDFLKAVWEGKGLTTTRHQKLLSWSTLSPRSGYGGWMGNRLPTAVRKTMHHKAGWLPPGTTQSAAAFATMNEIGIVRTPRGAYAVALLFAHGNDYYGKQQKGLEWASCVIYHALTTPSSDPFSAGCPAP